MAFSSSHVCVWCCFAFRVLANLNDSLFCLWLDVVCVSSLCGSERLPVLINMVFRNGLLFMSVRHSIVRMFVFGTDLRFGSEQSEFLCPLFVSSWLVFRCAMV